MSDFGRKDLGDKMKEGIQPDSTKSTQDKISEAFTDTTDRIARGLQPDQNKGSVQSTFDKGERMHDNEAHGGAGESVIDKVKNAVGFGNN